MVGRGDNAWLGCPSVSFSCRGSGRTPGSWRAALGWSGDTRQCGSWLGLRPGCLVIRRLVLLPERVSISRVAMSTNRERKYSHPSVKNPSNRTKAPEPQKAGHSSFVILLHTTNTQLVMVGPNQLARYLNHISSKKLETKRCCAAIATTPRDPCQNETMITANPWLLRNWISLKSLSAVGRMRQWPRQS